LHDREGSVRAGQEVNAAMVAEDELVFNAVEVIREMEEEMQKASAKLEFEKAAHLRDQIRELQKRAGLEKKDLKQGSAKSYDLGKKRQQSPSA
jgi:excinuclease ABC subunit B